MADVLRLDTFPTGLLLGVNGALPKAFSQGFVYKSETRLVRVENSTGGTLTGLITYGTGDIDLPGVTELTGTIALPTGASTAAKQDTGNTSLAAAAASLATLAATPTRTPRIVPFVAGTTMTITGARYLQIVNTGTVNVTVQISGQADFTLTSGMGVDWPLLHPLETGYTVAVVCPSGASGVLNYVL